jgi:elongation factor P
LLSTSDFRNGLKIEVEGEPYAIVEFQHVKPGKGGAFVRTKLRGIKTGSVIDRTFRSGEKFNKPNMEEREMQYLYASADQYFFMDNQTYEQIALTEENLGEGRKYLKENMAVKILFYNEKPIGVEVPMFVELKIVKTDPGVRGDTASGGTKPATLETGAVIKVPLYMNEGEIIKVDTRIGEYVERVR